MKTWPKSFLVVITATASLHATPITISGYSPYTQDFDTLANTGTSSTLPDGWVLAETGSGANTTYTGGTGSSSTANTYSLGAATSTERALGGLRSSTVIPTFGASFVNVTGSTVSDLDLSYVGEQWRLGAVGRIDRLDFQYSLDATSLTTGNWMDLDPLDFLAPLTSGTTGAKDGNATGNFTELSATIAAVNWLPASTLWVRWTDFDATGSEDGLAVDNFSLQAHQPQNQDVPESLPLGFVALTFLGVLGCRRALEQSRAR